MPGSWMPMADIGAPPQPVFRVPIGSNTRLFTRLRADDVARRPVDGRAELLETPRQTQKQAENLPRPSFGFSLP